MNRFFKILLILTIVLSGCSSSSLKDGESIGKNIIYIVSANRLDSLPAIIKLYNTLEDSLSMYDNTEIDEVNKGIIKATQDKNDTIKFCARIIMNTPEGFGSWMAEQYVRKITGPHHSAPESLLSEIDIIDFLYNKTGEPSSINEFQTAFNAHIDSLPVKKKIALYTTTLKPALLAKELAKEIESAAKEKDIKHLKETMVIIECIRKAYSPNKENTGKFNSILNSALNIMPDSIVQTINFYTKEKTK